MRRSVYQLSKELPISEDEVACLVKKVMRECPSAFNSQSSRAVILFGEQHTKLWNLTKDKLKATVKPDSYNEAAKKIDGCFAPAAGTILFLEDKSVVEGLVKSYPAYAEGFPVWSTESSGMAQFAVWTALAEKGIGASLQHYTSLIGEAVTAEWKLPATWEMHAQMPFGKPLEKCGEKTYMPDEERFKVFK
ncbi:hypothetical protein, conserved [Trypanosoma brucei brucei TREU927]|uniref:Nitroreductase domain-containing protein n=1 Tax=Trypanosoma brucei brucei (strain 927/4 GUTat10.1) TaxID=185431 RepID=Q57YB2_TRYB2|nr:hypothetical protein, conserved [Trypanosoma brucei brucei TREU927]AAX69431.1 hypothetical protein, conserved [Trypanosoma brucei]AAZ12366.1 hypothetical protein, conserved [Trypanosoma brucei brucei TREU927]